jgi:hypothetical protein
MLEGTASQIITAQNTTPSLAFILFVFNLVTDFRENHSVRERIDAAFKYILENKMSLLLFQEVRNNKDATGETYLKQKLFENDYNYIQFRPNGSPSPMSIIVAYKTSSWLLRSSNNHILQADDENYEKGYRMKTLTDILLTPLVAGKMSPSKNLRLLAFQINFRPVEMNKQDVQCLEKYIKNLDDDNIMLIGDLNLFDEYTYFNEYRNKIVNAKEFTELTKNKGTFWPFPKDVEGLKENKITRYLNSGEQDNSSLDIVCHTAGIKINKFIIHDMEYTKKYPFDFKTNDESNGRISDHHPMTIIFSL